MPLTTSSLVSIDFASSTVIAPSLPTFFIASARKRPISWSPFAEINLSDLLVRGDRPGVRLQMIDHRFDSEVHAAFEVHRVHAASDRLCAFVTEGRGRQTSW